MKLISSFLFFLIFVLGCAQPNPTEGNLNGNSPPEINSIITDPVFITVGTTANITVDATDPDGDALSYSWVVALGDIIGSGNQVKYTALHFTFRGDYIFASMLHSGCFGFQRC